jgi:membrane protein
MVSVRSERTKPEPTFVDRLPRPVREVWLVTWNAIYGMYEHDGINLASMIAFSLVFAIFPFVMFLTAVAGITAGPELADYLAREALAVMPDHIVLTIEPQLKAVLDNQNQHGVLTLSLFATLISITGAVEGMRDGLNRAYGCIDNRNFVHKRLHGLIFVFVGVAAIVLIATLALAAPAALRYAQPYFERPVLTPVLLEISRQVFLAIVLTTVLACLHLFLPARKRGFSIVATGVIVTLIGWWVAGKAFGFYLAQFANYAAFYAGLAGIVTLMLFLYIVALIFLFGAEVNRAVAERMGRHDLCHG